MKLKISIVFFIFVYSLVAQTQDWISTLSSREKVVKSFYMQVKATTVALNKEDKGKIRQEEWQFSFQDPGKFHIQYKNNGMEHIYICDYNTIYEYLPLYKQALQSDLSRLNIKKKNKKIAQALTVVQIPFLFVGDTIKKLKRRKINCFDKNIYLVTGYLKYNKKKSFLKIWINKTNLRPVRLELIQKKVVVLSIQYEEYGKFPFIPKKLVYFINSENKKVKDTMDIVEYKINPKLNENLFQFTPNEEIKIFQQKIH